MEVRKMPLPRSAYFRLVENRERGISAMKPDYPLILFVFLSRISMGVAILVGISQLLYTDPPLLTFNLLLALGLMLFATLFSITHLSVRWRFMAMARNLRSQISWEILLAGAYMGVVVLDLLYVYLRPASSVAGYGIPALMILFSLVALISQGTAYRFPSHPAWKNPLLSLFYLVSAPTVGLFIFWAEENLLGLQRGHFPSWIFPVFISILLVVQGTILYRYTGYVKQALRRGHEKTLYGQRRGLFFLYPVLYLCIPLCAALLSFWPGRSPPPISILGLFSILAGAFVERVLFFLLEEPVYFFNLSKGG